MPIEQTEKIATWIAGAPAAPVRFIGIAEIAGRVQGVAAVTTRRTMRAVVATGVLVCGPASTIAQASAPSLREVLTREFGLTSSDLAAVARGEIVAKTLPTQDQRDVAVIGIVRTDRRVRVPLPGTDDAVHVFARPASVADVQGFRLTREDIDELRRCRPSSCNFKLPAAAMEALHSMIDSSTSDVADRITAYVRQRIVDYVDAYRERGGAAMVVYDDLGSVQSSAAFDAMARDSSRVFRIAPSLVRYLSVYPRDSLPGATSAIVWSVDVIPRLRPVMRIMHHVVYTPPEDPRTTFVIAKQLYADHYFEAGLEAVLVTDEANAGFENIGSGREVGRPAGTVVVATRRYRFDHLPSGGPLDLRGRVLGGLRGAVLDDLRRLRDQASRTAPREQ